MDLKHFHKCTNCGKVDHPIMAVTMMNMGNIYPNRIYTEDTSESEFLCSLCNTGVEHGLVSKEFLEGDVYPNIFKINDAPSIYGELTYTQEEVKNIFILGVLFMLLYNSPDDLPKTKRLHKKVVRGVKKRLRILTNKTSDSPEQFNIIVSSSRYIMHHIKHELMVDRDRPIEIISPGALFYHLDNKMGISELIDVSSEDLKEYHELYNGESLGFPSLIYCNRIIKQADILTEVFCGLK